MQAKAIARNIRIAPRKARLVIDLIRGKSIEEAFAILRFTPRAASPIIEKVLSSAVANAENDYGVRASRLIVKEAFVDEGSTLKRHMPRAMGRASSIHKRTSHITVVVSGK
jgi:large subunit ribosomal protein L22